MAMSIEFGIKFAALALPTCWAEMRLTRVLRELKVMLSNFDACALESVLRFEIGFPFTLMAILCHQVDSTWEDDE